MTGLGVAIVGLFLAAISFPPPPVDGDGTDPDSHGDDDTSDGQADQDQDTVIVPQELFESTEESVPISENIAFIISKGPVTTGGFRPGIPVGGGGGNGDDVGEEKPSEILDARARSAGSGPFART